MRGCGGIHGVEERRMHGGNDRHDSGGEETNL